MTRPQFIPQFSIGNIITIAILIGQGIWFSSVVYGDVSHLKQAQAETSIEVRGHEGRIVRAEAFIAEGPRFRPADAKALKAEAVAESNAAAVAMVARLEAKLDAANKALVDIMVLQASQRKNGGTSP